MTMENTNSRNISYTVAPLMDDFVGGKKKTAMATTTVKNGGGQVAYSTESEKFFDTKHLDAMKKVGQHQQHRSGGRSGSSAGTGSTGGHSCGSSRSKNFFEKSFEFFLPKSYNDHHHHHRKRPPPPSPSPSPLVKTVAEAESGQVSQISSGGEHERGTWSGQADFLMSLIAYAVGLGNVWRFPYLCFKNGGGAFLVPYFFCWAIAAVPVFFMEVSIGQFLGEGGISVWNLCPIFRGVGVANTLIASFCNIYFPVIVAWSTFYLISTFTTSPLPWQTCSRSWNDPLCWDPKDNLSLSVLDQRGVRLNDTQSPVTQFWEKRVLKTSVSIDETGWVQWELLLLLAFVWFLTYFALWKGITNSRKLVYMCALTPYVLLVILLGRGLTLDGAAEGIKFYLKPDIYKLLKAEVWRDAGTQIFYSTGIGFGTLVALGSYNKYNHNVYRDSLILCVVNSMTSLMAGFVVFSVLGYMAKEAGKTVDQVVKSGVGLAFLVYPEAISTLPISQLWSVLFFLMIMILGLDSQVCMVEGVVLALTDQFPDTLRQHKKIFLAGLCFVGFLLGLPMICQSGQFWLTLVDSYGASGLSLLFVVFFEIIALSWVFGADKIYRALEDMLGFRPCMFWYLSWKYTSPLICTIIFGITICDYSPLMYPDQKTPYPNWAMVFGFLMSLTSMVSIPLYALYYVLKTPGSFKQRIKQGITPSIRLRFEKVETNTTTAIPVMDNDTSLSTTRSNEMV